MRGRTVLVTGATGFLGGALCLRLAADGAHVRALARSPQKAAFLRGQPNIEVVPGDVTAPEGLRPAIDGCEVVFHLAASVGSRSSQYAVTVEGTRNVARAAVSAGVKRMVFVSSIAAYGYRLEADTTEATPIVARSHDPYSETKAEAERVVVAIGNDGGIDYSIIRPGMIYGPRSVNWTGNLFRLARMKPTPFIGDGSGSAHPIYVDDVIDLIVTLGEHPGAANQTFNGTPDPAPTWREWLSHYQRLAGHQRWLVLPPGLFLPLADLAGALAPAGTEAREAPHILRMFQRQITHRMAKARDLLDWRPAVDLATGVERCAPWLRERGLLR